MSDFRPAVSNAALSSGRSLASHRGDVVASGRITPTLPLAEPPPLLPLEFGVVLPPLLLLPQPASTMLTTAAAAASPTLDLRILPSLMTADPVARQVIADQSPRIRSITS